MKPNLAPPAIAWKQVGINLQATGLFADVTNDGLPDFVQSYAGSGALNTVWRNTGDGWDAPDTSLAMPFYLTQLNTGSDSHVKGFMLDVNSDGRNLCGSE